MAKKAKGNRVQVILECTEMKEYSRKIGIEKIQSHFAENDSS